MIFLGARKDKLYFERHINPSITIKHFANVYVAVRNYCILENLKQKSQGLTD